MEVMEVKNFFREIRESVEHQASRHINWQKLEKYLASADHRFDELVERVYLTLKRLTCDARAANNVREVVRCLEPLFGMDIISEEQWREVADAFHQDSHGHQVSQSVYEEIIGFCRDYDSTRYVAPYTSIVGPSGIGKSYSVQQIAREYNIYVVYSSLAPRHASSYPRRTVLANLIRGHKYFGSLELLFECYLLCSLAVVELCRQVGITPTGHFYLQTRREHQEFDYWVGHLVERCYARCSLRNPPYYQRPI
jgi:hypothetical protein